MTEGWIWTGQYPESKRVIEKGNNQSMELSEEFLDASWTKDDNGKPKFFIINEAIISKLCILGEDVEPCFEGASITSFSLSFDDEFKAQLFSLMNELKDLMEKGGTPVFTTYAVEIGDALWSALYSHIEKTYPDNSRDYRCSVYRIEGIYEESGQKFAILQGRNDMKYYRLDFFLSDESGIAFSESLIEVSKTYVPASEPQFSEEAYNQYEAEYAAKKKEEEEKKSEKEDKIEQENTDNSKDNTEEEEKKKKVKCAQEKCAKCGKPLDECECEEEKDKKEKYSLEEIPEYIELQSKFSALETENSSLKEQIDNLNAQLNDLTSFKKQIEKKDKEAMINSFYMLSDEDKSDVIANIDTYSLEDIEAKLSIICVRNRVSFDLDKKEPSTEGPTVYNLNGSYEDTTAPAWIKAVRAVAKNMNN